MNFLKKLFRKKEAPKRTIPKAGELWKLFDKSPWPSNYPPVKILDCKDDWVRYDMECIFKDQREKLDIFLRLYEKVN